MPRKERVGTVVSNKMDKTIVVKVEEKRPNPKYKKYQNRSVKFSAHDENNTCHEGDVVRIVESRPISKNKNWQLKDIIERTQEV
ncbi:MAG: 30S ribosomal protein S17 [Vampirovibrio sp.]|nr:30S ribosomal protein S17 [Vampirovibrio sp.]